MNTDVAYNVESALASLNFAIREKERAEAQLYRSDGTPKYSPAEMAERLAVILVPVDRRYQRAKEAIETANKEAGRLELEISNRPTRKLTRAQMEEANLQMAFVREDCESMDLAALVERLEIIADEEDPVQLFLWGRYAEMRLQTELAKHGAGNRLVRALGAMSQRLSKLNHDPKLEEKKERAKQLRKAAADAFHKAHDRYTEATGEKQRKQDESSGFYRGMF